LKQIQYRNQASVAPPLGNRQLAPFALNCILAFASSHEIEGYSVYDRHDQP